MIRFCRHECAVLDFMCPSKLLNVLENKDKQMNKFIWVVKLFAQNHSNASKKCKSVYKVG